MKLEYYAADVGNFGDDLNPWLWPKIFPGMFDSGAQRRFIGIGSILDGRFSHISAPKIVFGTGARSPNTLPRIDKTWDIRFVRGPLTAQALELPNSAAICDSALAMAFLDLPNPPREGIGFMPHFRTAGVLPWKFLTEFSNVRLIDPRASVETVLEALSGCDRLITEAMHGAIVADLLRIPWLRVRCHSHLVETTAVSEFKWSDWARGLNVDTLSHPLPDMGAIKGGRCRRIVKRGANLLRSLPIVFALRRLAQSQHFQLSKADRIRNRIEQLEEQVRLLQSEYPNETL